MDLSEMVAAGTALGVIVASALVGAQQWLAKKLHVVSKLQGSSLAAELASQIRKVSGDDLDSAVEAARSDADVVLGELGRHVRIAVKEENRPMQVEMGRVRAELARMREDVELLMHDSDIATARFEDHSSAIKQITTGAHQILEADPEPPPRRRQRDTKTLPPY